MLIMWINGSHFGGLSPDTSAFFFVGGCCANDVFASLALLCFTANFLPTMQLFSNVPGKEHVPCPQCIK